MHVIWARDTIQKVFVGVKLILEETGKLIECVKKKGKESVEKMKSASTTDVPGQGKKNGKPSDKSRGHKKCLSTYR